jgi:hypothetical protein
MVWSNEPHALLEARAKANVDLQQSIDVQVATDASKVLSSLDRLIDAISSALEKLRDNPRASIYSGNANTDIQDILSSSDSGPHVISHITTFTDAGAVGQLTLNIDGLVRQLHIPILAGQIQTMTLYLPIMLPTPIRARFIGAGTGLFHAILVTRRVTS